MIIRNSVLWLALAGCAAGACLAANAYAGDTQYAYDALGRLVQVTYPNGTVIKYSYDSAGNRVAVTVTLPPASTWGNFTWGHGTW